MAWNTPGSDNDDNDRRPRPRRRVAGPGDVLGHARRLLEGAGGPWRWLALLVGAWIVFSGLVVVDARERAVVLRFGQFVRVLQPGPHLKLPWPIERAFKVDATTVRTYTQTVPVLTADENIVNVDMNVQYRVDDPETYLFGARDAEQMLRDAAVASVREAAARTRLDALLNAGPTVASGASTRLAQRLRADRTGLVVTALTLPGVRPPDEVRDAFDEVGRAEQAKARAISEAQAYAAKVIPEARGDAARIIATAQGEKAAAIARATGDAQRFSLLVEQYKAAPDITRKRLWLETVQDVLARNRTIVGGDSRQVIYVPMPTPPASSASTPPAATANPVVPPLLAPVTAPPSPPAAANAPDVLPPVTATGERGPRAPRAPRSGDDR